MVGLNNRVFLVTGKDFAQRRLAIDGIKKKVLKKASAYLNILTFYGKEIILKDLKEKIFTFSFEGEKIILIKDADRLSKEIREFLLGNFKKIISCNYLILETEIDYAQLGRDKKISADKFFNFILKHAEIPFKYRNFSTAYGVSFEAFKKSVRANDLSNSLYILGKLFDNKISDREKEIFGLQILGVLVGECSYLRNPLLREATFKHLWATDRLIKEGAYSPRFALEVLLTKLLSTELV